MGRIRRARALQGHRRVGKRELGDPAVSNARIGLVGVHVDVAGDARTRRQRLRIGSGRRRDVLAEVTDDARHPAPIVGRRDQSGVRPVLRQGAVVENVIDHRHRSRDPC